MIPHPLQRRKHCDARIFDMTAFPGTRRGTIAALMHAGAKDAWIEEDNEGVTVYYTSNLHFALCDACDSLYSREESKLAQHDAIAEIHNCRL